MITKQFTKKLMAAAILSLFSQTSYAAINEQECNSTDTLQGWGFWCGVDTYLSQQEPTAAGPVSSNNGTLDSAIVDGDEFGGQLQEDNFNWRGYAYVNITRMNQEPNQREPEAFGYRNQYMMGILQLKLDPDNNDVLAVMTLEDGSKITFNQNANFIEPVNRPDSTYGEFQVVSEDGKYQINALPSLALRIPYSRARTTDTVTSGGIRHIDGEEFRVAGFVAGSPTSLSDMARLQANSRVAHYSTNGDYRGATGCCPHAYMTVNFGDASWYGNWHGLHQGPGYIRADGSVSGNQFSSSNLSIQGIKPPPPPPPPHNNPPGFPPESEPVSAPAIYYNPTVSGNVLGSFNGTDARNLTGMIDVTVAGRNSVGVFVGTQAPNDAP